MAGFAHSRYVTIADQIVSSLSNFALVALVANVSSPADFGRFSLGYVVLVFFLGFQRSLVGEVLLVRFSSVTDRPADVDDAAAGVSVGVGVLSAVVLAGVAAVTGGDPRVWVALALAGPVVFVQDIARYVLIARGRSGDALVSDLVWLVAAFPVMGVLVLQGAPAWTVVTTWALGGLVAALLALRRSRVTPRPARGARWLAQNRDIAVRFSGEYASLNLSNTVVWFFMAGPVGVAGVAALRGASLLFSPLNTAFNAVRIAVVPELVRATEPARYRARVLETVVVLAVLGIGWGAVVLLLPDAWGALVLGETWAAAAQLRWPYAVQGLAMVCYTVLLARFRAQARHRQSTLMRGSLALLTLALPLALAATVGTAGAAWGFAIAVLVCAAVGAVAEVGTRRSARA